MISSQASLRLGAPPRTLPAQLDRHALLLELGCARIPDRHHVDLAVADELLRLVALPPPHLDMRLDAVELPECALDVEGVERIARHPVGEQRENHAARRVADAQAPAARKLLDIPEIPPRSRAAIG